MRTGRARRSDSGYLVLTNSGSTLLNGDTSRVRMTLLVLAAAAHKLRPPRVLYRAGSFFSSRCAWTLSTLICLSSSSASATAF